MFGYIVINKAEMKFKDFDIYHAYYCGLCRVLKKQYGMIGQLTLSYDMTFLLLLLSGLYEPEDTDMHVTCTAHPFHKHAARVNAFTSYAAIREKLQSLPNGCASCPPARRKMTGIWITWPGSLAELWQKSLHTGRMNGNLLFGNSDFFLENSFI